MVDRVQENPKYKKNKKNKKYAYRFQIFHSSSACKNTCQGNRARGHFDRCNVVFLFSPYP